jgi:hypothetical protein
LSKRSTERGPCLDHSLVVGVAQVPRDQSGVVIEDVFGDAEHLRELLDQIVGGGDAPVVLEVVQVLWRDRPPVLFPYARGELPLAQVGPLARLGDGAPEAHVCLVSNVAATGQRIIGGSLRARSDGFAPFRCVRWMLVFIACAVSLKLRDPFDDRGQFVQGRVDHLRAVSV